MAKSVVETAIASIDAQIADLNRAKDIILAANTNVGVEDAPAPKKRGRKRKGLPPPASGQDLDAVL